MINAIKPNYLSSFSPDLNELKSLLIDLIQEGVMFVSQNLEPIYLNSKAREICQQLWLNKHHSDNLPPIVTDIYYRLTKNSGSKHKEVVIEYQINDKQTIRIRACQLIFGVEDRPWLLVFLEDRSVSLQEELWIEKKRYDLTERETQILNLLSKAYTYQEIAETLQISLNTVKFHAKNIYAKKRSCLGPKKLYLEIDK